LISSPGAPIAKDQAEAIRRLKEEGYASSAVALWLAMAGGNAKPGSAEAS
jgi:hypothetical protein